MFPETLGIITTLLFGATAIFFAIKEERQKALIKKQEILAKQRIYQVSILKEIQERIGYELDIEKVVEVITASIKNIFPYSTTSSLIIKKGDGLVFRTYVEEGISHGFVEQVKNSMVASLSALFDNPLPSDMKEYVAGVVLDDVNTKPLASFFHIPLVINDKVVGLINISSTKPGLYKEDEMTILYQITHQASSALSRLTQVLETEKGKLLATIGSLEDGLFMIDKNNELLVINDAAQKMLRIEKENPNILDVLGSLQSSFDIGKTLQYAFASKKVIEEKEIRLGEVFVRVYVNPVIDEKSNTVIGVSVLLHDITLQRNLAQLKEDFTNMMVHELRAPLTAIRGATALILSEQGVKEEHAKLLGVIKDQSERLLTEVSSLLDAAKLEAGRFVVEKKAADIKALISEKIRTFSAQAQEKKVSLFTHIQDALPNFAFDYVRVGQVLNNLLSNSLKFTPEGGKITIKVAKGTQETSFAGTNASGTFGSSVPSGSWIVISVSDTGVGIPKEKQAKLFSKFAQAPSPRAGIEHQAGTGLGLYIAKGIVEAHGGKINLSSEEGRGTTITFTLPIEQEILVSEASQNPASSNQLYKTSIN